MITATIDAYDISFSSLYPDRLLHLLLQPDVISSLALALIESKKNSGCKSKKAYPYRYFMVHMWRDGRNSVSGCGPKLWRRI
jgi:hypothetical protein